MASGRVPMKIAMRRMMCRPGEMDHARWRVYFQSNYGAWARTTIGW
jgi:hypothetical protein